MKFRWMSLFGIAVAACGGWMIGSTTGSEPKGDLPLVHVVLFNFKDEASASAREELVRDAHAMLGEIPVVAAVRCGRRTPGDREVHVKDYDVAMSLYLEKASDIQAYLDHPLHVAFAEKHGERIAKIRVCDFYDEQP